MKKWIQLLAAAAGMAWGFEWSHTMGNSFSGFLTKTAGIETLQGQTYWMMAAGAVVTMLAAGAVAKYGMRLVRLGEDRLAKMPLRDLLSGLFGTLLGLFASFMLFPALGKLESVGTTLSLLVAAGAGFLGYRAGYAKRDELAALFGKLSFSRDNEEQRPMIEEHKILDTSVIIDGRIADICKTGFIEGTLVIPEFVLEELQHIADSSDLLKRNRGRRGLDILNKIQKELDVQVLIYEGDFDEISEVDSKLVRLAKVLHGKVITNDFNLNKVCELQGVSVLNINDLANAVKPVVLPGEEIIVQIIKDGKEHGQGVAYLDDGTMIVVEGGRDFIGSTMEVMVTSVLQTSAGRMIFAKPKLLEKAQ